MYISLDFTGILDKLIAMQRIFDTIGLTVSGTCAIHCLFAPVTVILFPIIGLTVLDEHTFHEIILYFILPCALMAFTMGCRKHKDYSVATLAVIGIFLLISATVLHDMYSSDFIRIITLLGSSLLIVSHIRNYFLCRKADCRHDHH